MILTQAHIDTMGRWKEQSGLTNKQIGDMVGLSEASVQRYITGNIKDAPEHTVRRVIEAIGGDPTEVLGGASASSEPHSIDLYERMIETVQGRCDEELARMQAAHEEAIAVKDLALQTLEANYESTIAYQRKWISKLTVLVLFLFGLIVLALLIDILNPHVGWIRRALFSDPGTRVPGASTNGLLAAICFGTFV